MPRFTHTLDVAFNVQGDSDDWGDLQKQAILDALRARLDYLTAHPDECADAFGHVDTYEGPS
jgi:hypothetical protein